MVKKPVRSIVGAIAAAAACWSDAEFAPRARIRQAVSARTGYSLPAVDFAFDALFGSLRRDAIEAVIVDELGSLDALDGFAARPGRPPARALPYGRVCIVSSRTTIGVAIIPAMFALCAKCDVIVKDRDDLLVAAFFDTLGGELRELRDAATARAWAAGDDHANLGAFDAVVAFGSDSTLAEIAGGLPFSTRLIPYGSRASAGYVAREALANESAAREIARGAARDLVLYETEGCLSLHVLFAERGGAISPAAFAQLLVAEMRAAADDFPPGSRSAVGAARRAAARDLETFRGGGSRVYSDPDAACLAVLDPPPERPPAFLPLAIGIHSIEHASQAADYLKRHGIAIEALAIAHRRPDLLSFAAQIGAARLAPFGALQAPPLGVFHGGRPRIAEFVRWIVDET
jgi:hypothetical protein